MQRHTFTFMRVKCRSGTGAPMYNQMRLMQERSPRPYNAFRLRSSVARDLKKPMPRMQYCLCRVVLPNGFSSVSVASGMRSLSAATRRHQQLGRLEEIGDQATEPGTVMHVHILMSRSLSSNLQVHSSRFSLRLFLQRSRCQECHIDISQSIASREMAGFTPMSLA